MNDKDVKLIELEKEFREKVVSELKTIRFGQSDLERCVEKLDKKLDLNIQKIEFELSNIKKLDESQNQMLDEHMKRSDMLEQLVVQNKEETCARLEALEEPKKTLVIVRNWIIGLGALSGAIYATMRLLGYIN